MLSLFRHKKTANIRWISSYRKMELVAQRIKVKYTLKPSEFSVRWYDRNKQRLLNLAKKQNIIFENE